MAESPLAVDASSRLLPLPPLPPLRLAQAPCWQPGTAAAIDLAALDALLLAWLALVGPTPRERLAALLWPQSEPEAARNALRQRLFRLRKQLGRELVSGTGLVALAADVRHDLAESSTLLGALQASGCPELEAWLATERASRRALARGALEAQIAALEARGDAGAALPLALALLDAEPLSEDAHRRVMRLHYLRGDRAGAMLAFDRCEALLKDEVGTTPSAETLALLHTIDVGTRATAPHTLDVGDVVPLAAAAPAPRSHSLPVTLLRPPRLVGRDAELALLRGGWQAGSVVLVQGEAGMGKSRLLQVLAGDAPALVLSAGRPGDSLVPYASIARLLKELIERLPAALPAPLRQRLAPMLPMLDPDAGMRAAKVAARHSAPLLAPVQELLARARGHIDGLVLDDLHFADGASVELVQALLTAPRGDAPQRWCLGLRPPQAGSRQEALLAALAQSAPLTHVPLQALDVAQMAELIDSLHIHGVHGAALAVSLRQRSGGNPLFALETLKLAWAEGALNASAELPRSTSLAQLIGLQLARLSAPALARLAAVAGVDFSLPLAEQVTQQNALMLADAWHELEVQQVLVGSEFAHDLIFETVLAAVPAVIARHLHARLAEQLAASDGEPARVAAHWEAAGQRERALPSLRLAAERAHAALREHERIEFLLRAADIAQAQGDLGEAFDCVARAVDSHMNTIRQASGYPLLDRLDGLARNPTQRAHALGRRAWYCTHIADEAGAVRYGEEALALANPLGDAPLLAVIRQRLATALGQAGRFDEALPHFEAVLPQIAELLGDEERAEFHGNFAAVLDNLGRSDAASVQRRQAIEASCAAGDPAQQVSQLANHAVSLLSTGDVAQASSALAQARSIVGTYNMQGSTVGFVAVLRMQCARALGAYADALAAADEADAELVQSNPARLPVVQLHRAHCWLDLGQHARASQALAAAQQGAPLPPHFAARRLVLAARLARLQGADAAPLLAQAQALVPRLGWPEIACIVDAESALGLPLRDALALLDAALVRARAARLRGAELAALLRRTQVLLAAGDVRAAASARAALQLAKDVEPTLMYRGEVALPAVQALHLAGAKAEAATVLAAAQAWVRARCEADVPAPFCESFLQRNPINAALLRLA